MIMDNLLVFSDDQALSSSPTYSKILDMGAGGDAARELYFNVQVAQALVGSGSIAIRLETSDAPTMANATALTTSATINSDVASGSFVFSGRMAQGMKRYLRVRYDRTGTISTVPVVTSYLSDSVQTNGAS